MNGGKANRKKLFVASSSSRKALVEAFKREILKQAEIFGMTLEVQSWYHDAAKPGDDIVTTLTAHCRGNPEEQVEPSDYFAAILTDDDFACQTSPAPRENVIFELGFFLGGLGFDLRRCFTLCTAPKRVLLSDLGGRTYIKLDVPRGTAPSDYDSAVESAAGEVIRQIYEPIKTSNKGVRESISEGELLKREKLEGRNGRLLENSEVLVNRGQPMEVSTREIAAQVDKNILDGVTYRYFFHMPDFATIARLLYYVATSNPDENGKPRPQSLSGTDLEKHLQEKIARQLSINLLPKQGSLDFCVHNAHTYNGSTCYVRDPSTNQFVNLCENQIALNIAEKLRSLEIVPKPPLLELPRVFRRTETFDLYHSDYERQKSGLWDAIREKFRTDLVPDLEKTLRKVCFGEETP